LKTQQFLLLWAWRRVPVHALTFFLLMITMGALYVAQAQTISLERERGRIILSTIKKDIKDNYYDPTFRGVDLDARFKSADEKIKSASSNGQIFRIIAAALDALNDSHTFMIPPERSARTDYGWQMQMIGSKPFIIAVKPGSDAEAQGIKIGDEIYSIDGYEPTRDNLWKMQYVYYGLEPRSAVQLVVIGKDGQQREVLVKSKVSQGKPLKDLFYDMFDLIRESERASRLYRQRSAEVGQDLFIWKMPEFYMTDEKLDAMMDKVRDHKALILDLRGNGGGSANTFKRLVSYFFDHEIKTAELKSRKETKLEIVKPRGDKVFKGQVTVLVDSRSASAAEMFARIIQLEKRGTVLGDRTSGAVMQSRYYDHEVGTDILMFYGVSVTNADVIMSDGKSLEGVGVTPDELRLPTAEDMRAGRDPVLARAAELLGVKLEPEKAYALFPIEWQK
jgi:C-terminal processing protease CtpA/Prc